jgi:hypothetical protein
VFENGKLGDTAAKNEEETGRVKIDAIALFDASGTYRALGRLVFFSALSAREAFGHASAGTRTFLSTLQLTARPNRADI